MADTCLRPPVQAPGPVITDTLSGMSAAVASESNADHAAVGRRPDYLFIHNMRFWSMVAIVAIHTVALLGSNTGLLRIPYALLLVQPFKFGTICFFLVSGFLMGDRLPSCRPADYMKRRLDRLFLPWLFWVLFTLAAQELFSSSHPTLRLLWNPHLFRAVRHDARSLVMFTSFWFVPNLVIAMCCLVVFRKRLNDLRVGAVFLAMNLFYTVNIYFHWVATSHTEALFGFVFYLWLGAWCARNIGRVRAWSDRLDSRLLTPLILLSALAAVAEAHLISPRDMAGQNTIRITNQIFSLLVSLALFRLRGRTWPRFVDVSRHTYGVYLIHSVVILILAGVLSHQLWWRTPLGSLAAGILLWVVSYTVSLGVTVVLSSEPGLAWTVGARTKKKPAHAVKPGAQPLLPAAPLVPSA